MPTTPWDENPMTFHEPWCPECGADSPRTCQCGDKTKVTELGEDTTTGEPVYDDDLGPTVRTDGDVTTHGFDKLPPIGGSKWSSRYASEKTGGAITDTLMTVPHLMGQGISWLGDAMTHPLQSHLPAGAAEKIQKIKDLVGVYPAGSYQKSHLLQQISDLEGNRELNSLPKAVVGIGADAMAALSTHPLVTKGIPKMLENLGIRRPKPPHLDFSEMTEK